MSEAKFYSGPCYIIKRILKEVSRALVRFRIWRSCCTGVTIYCFFSLIRFKYSTLTVSRHRLDGVVVRESIWQVMRSCVNCAERACQILRSCGFMLRSGGGVLKDTFWSPWPRSLKPSKIALSSARRQHYFRSCWKFVERMKNSLENVSFWRSPENFSVDFFFWDRLKNLFEDLFFFFFGEHLRLSPWSLALAWSIPVLDLERVCPRKGCPWPRIFFCVLGLGLERCVLDSTSAPFL